MTTRDAYSYVLRIRELEKRLREYGDQYGDMVAHCNEALNNKERRIAELEAENSNLLQELREPESPEGRAYQSEVTRLEAEVERLKAEHYWDLLEQMRDAWGMHPGQQIGACEVEAFLMAQVTHKPRAKRIAELEGDK